jgi:glycosyltransferase involved in cell wall biosynthesis
MRVLFLAHNFPRYSGDPVGSFILRLAVALKTHGIDVHVVAPAAANAPQEAIIEGIPVSRYHYAPRRLETLAYTGTMGTQVRRFWGARLAMLGLVVSGYRAAMRVAARTKIDVVHAHWWFPGGLVARAIRARKGIPYVVTMHGSDIRLGSTAPGGPALFKAVAGQAFAITTVSTWLAAQARQLDPATVPVVAPMPVAPDLFHPGEGRIADRLLFIGKLTPQKGLEYLLRALARMKSRPTVDVVGAGRVDDAHLRDLAVQLGVADRVTWHPLLTQAELAVLYRTAAIHVIPAIEEGLGLTAVEALLSETPVVAFDSGGIPDIVVDGQTGLLVPPGDTGGLAVAVDRLLADSEYRLRLGREGRRFALTHFGPDAVARQYATLLTDAARRT